MCATASFRERWNNEEHGSHCAAQNSKENTRTSRLVKPFAYGNSNQSRRWHSEGKEERLDKIRQTLVANR
jgi:hypothetical protein